MFPAPQTPVGRSFTADDLHNMHLAKIRSAMTEELPSLRDKAITILADKLRNEHAIEELKRELNQHLGPDSVVNAIEMLTRDAKVLVLAERAELATKPTPQRAADMAARAAIVVTSKENDRQRRPGK